MGMYWASETITVYIYLLLLENISHCFPCTLCGSAISLLITVYCLRTLLAEYFWLFFDAAQTLWCLKIPVMLIHYTIQPLQHTLPCYYHVSVTTLQTVHHQCNIWSVGVLQWTLTWIVDVCVCVLGWGWRGLSGANWAQSQMCCSQQSMCIYNMVLQYLACITKIQNLLNFRYN